MIKIFFAAITATIFFNATFPDVKVAGEMKNIMMKGNFKAFANLDTFTKANLYALGPVEDLKGEIMVLNGEVYSSTKSDTSIVNKINKANKAAMLVYSYVKSWKEINVYANVHSYEALENLIATTAKQNGYDTTVPFSFKIEAIPSAINYHIIDWEKAVKHTMENHKQFAYKGKTENSNVTLLGFYSDHHHSIFTHHTTNMHMHVLDEKTKNVGHLDNIKINGSIKIYFPVS
jgi:acetolactate decarboxylase